VGRAKSLAIRCDLDNGLGLCAGCHTTIDQVAEEKRALFLRHLGLERYERLELMRQSRARVDMRLVVLSLEREWEALCEVTAATWRDGVRELLAAPETE
jgi:hypothetical protein